MAKLTLEEKRLQNLRKQLFGTGSQKLAKTSQKSAGKSELKTAPIDISVSHTTNTLRQDNLSFRKDIMKVAILSSILIAAQLGIYFGVNQGIIKFPF